MKDLLIAISIISGGLGIGLLLEKILFKKIKKLVTQKKWKTGKVLMDSLKGKVVFLITFFCIYFTIPYMSVLEFQPRTVTIISKVIIVLILLILTLIFQRFLSNIVLNYLKLTLPTTTSIFKNIINISVLILGLFVIFQTIGIKITPLITALGVGGLAVALALQDSLSNLFAGLHIIAVKQIKVGDYIKLESGEQGYVVDIGWRNTTIRMIPNNLVIVPNSKIASSIVVNYNLPEQEMAVKVDVGVSYDSDLEKVEKVTIEVAKEVMREVEGGIPAFEPFIRYHTFGDFSINFTVIMRCKEYIDQYRVKHEFIKRLHKRYKKEKIEIPFPIRTIYMAKHTGKKKK